VPFLDLKIEGLSISIISSSELFSEYINNAVEKQSKKSGTLLSITFSAEISGSETDVITGNEFMMKMITEIPKRSMIIYFRRMGEFSLF